MSFADTTPKVPTPENISSPRTIKELVDLWLASGRDVPRFVKAANPEEIAIGRSQRER